MLGRPKAAVTPASWSGFLGSLAAFGALATTGPACFSSSHDTPAQDAGPGIDSSSPGDATIDAAPEAAPADAAGHAPFDAPFDATPDVGADAAGVDASDGGAPVDAADAGPACNLTMPFGPRSLVAGLATPGSDEYAARLTADQLTAYFQSNRPNDGGVPGFFEIYAASRPSVSAPFGSATIISSFIAGNVEKPTITADGLTLYATQEDPDDAGGFTTSHVFASTRASPSSAFPAPSVVSGIFLPGGFERDPFVTADGNTLYFMDFYNLYVSTLVGGGFGAPVEITAASSAGDVQGGPVVSADGLTLYFFSSRALVDGGVGADNNVFVSHRATTGDPFGPPVNVAELNTPANDEPVWLSPDGCTLWFASTLTAAEDAGFYDSNTHVFKATHGP